MPATNSTSPATANATRGRGWGLAATGSVDDIAVPSAAWYLGGDISRYNVQDDWQLELGDGSWTVGGAQSPEPYITIADPPQSKIYAALRETYETWMYKDYGTDYWSDFEFRWVWRFQGGSLGPDSAMYVLAIAADQD